MAQKVRLQIMLEAKDLIYLETYSKTWDYTNYNQAIHGIIEEFKSTGDQTLKLSNQIQDMKIKEEIATKQLNDVIEKLINENKELKEAFENQKKIIIGSKKKNAVKKK